MTCCISNVRIVFLNKYLLYITVKFGYNCCEYREIRLLNIRYSLFILAISHLTQTLRVCFFRPIQMEWKIFFQIGSSKIDDKQQKKVATLLK